MHTERERRLAAICVRQHGVVTRDQLLHDIGVSPGGIKRLLDSGRLTVLRRGIYLLGGAKADLRGAIFAATVGTRTSVGSHRGAAQLWHLPGGAELVEVASPRWQRLRTDQIAGFDLVVHESLYLSERDVVEVDGIWRTRVARTLIDLGASVALGHIQLETLVLAVQDAIRRNLTDVAQLEAAFARLSPEIRIGARHFRRALDRFTPLLNKAESTPEVSVGQVLIDAGYRVIPQFDLILRPSWTARLDYYLPDYRHGVEVSPDYTHGGMLQRQYDLARALEIRAVHGVEISVVGDDEIAAGCPRLLAVLQGLRRVA